MRTILEYCSPLFVSLNRNNRCKINSIQRRFHNLVCYYKCNCDILENLDHRRINQSVKLFLKSSNIDHSLHSIIPLKRTTYLQPYSRSQFRQNYFVPFVVEVVNCKIT